MMNASTWRQELISEIRTIANPVELKRLWSGSDPNEISSFAEEVAHVFDDYDIDGFLDAGSEAMKLTTEQYEALRVFRDRFSEYVDRVRKIAPITRIDPNRVLDDPSWATVVKPAERFIGLIDGERK